MLFFGGKAPERFRYFSCGLRRFFWEKSDGGSPSIVRARHKATTTTTMARFVDEDAVSRCLVGAVSSSQGGGLRLLKPFPEIRVCVRSDRDEDDKARLVSLVSGGGSGHER